MASLIWLVVVAATAMRRSLSAATPEKRVTDVSQTSVQTRTITGAEELSELCAA